MGFDAAEIEDELSWNFSKFIPNAEGVTPEPSTALVLAYQKRIKDILAPVVIERAEAEESRGPDWKPTAADMREVFERQDDAHQLKMLEQIIEATARVCQQSPSKVQIKALPFRIQQHFLGYVAGKFLGEVSTPVMTS